MMGSSGATTGAMVPTALTMPPMAVETSGATFSMVVPIVSNA